MYLRLFYVLSCIAFYSEFAIARAGTVAFMLSNNFTANENALTVCDVSENSEFTNCKVAEGANFVNPVSVDYSTGEIFIANYGYLGVSGTSFAMRCRLDAKDHLACKPFLARASAYHLAAIKILSNKLFYVEAYAHLMTNFPYLVACDFKDAILSKCGVPAILKAGNQTDRYAISSVDIVFDKDRIYVTDPRNQHAFQCSFPDSNNYMKCTEANGMDQVKTLDIGSAFICDSSSQRGEVLDKLTCCSRSDDHPECGSQSGGMVYNPTSLSIDNNKNVVYLTNANSPPSLQGSGLSKCQLSQKGEVLGPCRFIYPNMGDSDSIPREFSRVLVTQWNTTRD